MLSTTVPSHDAAFLSLLFQRPGLEILKANVRLSVTLNMSLLDLLLVYRETSYSSICKTIIIIIIFTVLRISTSVLSSVL